MDAHHLLDIQSLSDRDISSILERAEIYAKGMMDQTLLRGQIIFNLFFENSTRTATSFETAAKRLGAEVVHWSRTASSMAKGESFADTIATLSAMGPDAIILRHEEYGTPGWVAAHVRCPVINGGDSWRAHPTQALLDALTLRQHFGNLKGLEVAICGDIAHSRVANSNMRLLPRLGVRVRVIAPPAFMPESLPEGVLAFSCLEEGLSGVQAIMMLRIQNERMAASDIPDPTTYHAHWGLTLERLALAAPGSVVLHPGPMNRGIEIADDVADDPQRSLILKQVANGVPVRMAVLDLLLSSTRAFSVFID